MTSAEYQRKLRDPRWQKFRALVHIRDNWECTACGRDDLTLVAHHDEYHGEPWEAPFDKVRTLCERCHEAHHRKLRRKEMRSMRTPDEIFRDRLSRANDAIAGLIALWTGRETDEFGRELGPMSRSFEQLRDRIALIEIELSLSKLADEIKGSESRGDQAERRKLILARIGLSQRRDEMLREMAKCRR